MDKMKVMICNSCGDMVIPEKAGLWQWCLCGHIGGMYLDSQTFCVAMRDTVSGRVVGLDGDVLHGLNKTGTIERLDQGEGNVIEMDWNEAKKKYGYTGGYSDTLVGDLHRLIVGNSDHSPCFSEMVFMLVFKADRDNRRLLKKSFPIHVDMVDRYQYRDGVIQHPHHPEFGHFAPDAGGRLIFHPYDKSSK